MATRPTTDPPGTIRRAQRRTASLDHALTPQIVCPPVVDRATPYPAPRRDQPTLRDTKRPTQDRS